MRSIHLFLLAGTIAIFTSCNDKSASTTAGTSDSNSTASGADATQQRNRQAALASIQNGVNQHNVEVLIQAMTPDAVDYGDGSNPPVRGADSIRIGLQQWFAAFPDVKGENLKATSDGEWVMVWGDWTGTWKGDMMGQKATGKSYKAKDVDIFRFNAEGKMTEHHNVQPWSTVAAQVGVKGM